MEFIQRASVGCGHVGFSITTESCMAYLKIMPTFGNSKGFLLRETAILSYWDGYHGISGATRSSPSAWVGYDNQ